MLQPSPNSSRLFPCAVFKLLGSQLQLQQWGGSRQQQAASHSPPCSAKETHGQGLGGGHDSLTLAERRHVAAGTRMTILLEHGFTHQPSLLCRRPLSLAKRSRDLRTAQRLRGHTWDMPAGPHAPGGIFSSPSHCVAFENHSARHSFGGEPRRICPGACGSGRASLCYGKDTSRAFSVQNEHHFVQAPGQPAGQVASCFCCGFPCCAQLNSRYQSQVQAEGHGFAICGHPRQTKCLAWSKQLLWSHGRDARSASV